MIPELMGYEIHVAFLGGIIRGIGASKEANRLKRSADAINPVRPTYEIPQEVSAYLENAINMYGGDMPGYNRAIDQAYSTTGNMVDTARNTVGSGTSLLQALSQFDANQRRNINNINTQNAGFRQNNFRTMQDALAYMAGYRDEAFNINQFQPYQQQELDKRAYQEAAINQRNASRDAWGAFADGAVDTATTLLTGGGSSLFKK